LPDTSPPLYYSTLFWVRRLIADERTAMTVLNLAALAAAFIAVSLASRRAGVLAWAFIAQSSFLLSAPALRYTLEGRGYLMALSVTFVASWYCALAIEVPDRRPRSLTFAILGLLAASIHLFAALICGCLAAGLVGLSVLTRDKTLLPPALALGVSACVITILWIPFVISLVGNLSWNELSSESLLAAYWEIRLLLGLGSRPAILLLAALLAVGFALPVTRSLTVAFGFAFVLFVVLPVLISLKQPLIAGRWWLIGAPCLTVYVSFIARALFAHRGSGARGRLYEVGSIVGLSFLAVTSVGGYAVARNFTAGKWSWSGAAIVAPLLRSCPPGSIHVRGLGFIAGFAFAARAPEYVFANVDPPETPWIGAGDSTCPVLGWAEHVVVPGHVRVGDDFVLGASDDELLKLVKIRALPSEVNIYRHQKGFVVLRRGALGNE
jgi:hypothetical protein